MATALRAADDLAATYRAASPFPHAVIEDYFDGARIVRAAREVAGLHAPGSAEFYGQHLKGGTQDRQAMGQTAAGLIDEMNSPAFVRWLEWLTGIDGLISDTDLFGGGVHQVKPGGFLKIHTDFSWHERLQLYRRVNVLLYLDEGWQDAWGGHLELWPASMDRCGAKIAPTLGRMVVFNTTDESFHGHPEPLACPEDRTRNSIALYYYTREPDGARSTLTNYQPRPAERFFGVRRLIHKAKRLGLGALS
jgi:hypothetical protein